MLAAIIYCNPFHKRFQGYLDQWLNSSNSDDSDLGMSIPRRCGTGTLRTIAHTSHTSEEQLLCQQNRCTERTFREMKLKPPAIQMHNVFTNLALIQMNIRDMQKKHGQEEFQSFNTTSEIENWHPPNAASRGNDPKICNTNRKTYQAKRSSSITGQTDVNVLERNEWISKNVELEKVT